MSSSSTTKIDLLLLGLLLDRPMHGYELYQQIQSEGIDDWFNVSMPGVYYSLGKLRDHSFVAESRQRGGRSARKSIYRLTEDGRAAFFAAMEAQATSHDDVYLEYDLVIYLLNRLPVQRAIPLLQDHQSFLAKQSESVEAAISAEQGGGNSPLKIAVLDHKRRYLSMEQEWLADVVQDIQEQTKDYSDQNGKRRGLMILSGDLRNYHLPDLIRLIVSGQHNGTLAVTNGVNIRTLGFEDGQMVCASDRPANEPDPPAPSYAQIREGLSDLFRWQEGSFTFEQGTVCADWCVPMFLGTADLILCGCRLVDSWDIIQRLISSADIIFELGVALEDLGSLSLSSVEEQILSSIDGIKDVASVARELGLTVFEASRAFYCLASVGVVRTADLDKIRLRRVFREIAELMCSSTIAWRATPDDRTCEEEVNHLTEGLPLCLNRGQVEDQADPQLRTDGLVEMYHKFLLAQLDVVSRRFGRENARQSFKRTIQQLSPELQDAAKRYGFDKMLSA